MLHFAPGLRMDYSLAVNQPMATTQTQTEHREDSQLSKAERALYGRSKKGLLDLSHLALGL